MDAVLPDIYGYNTRLSFVPLVNAWKKLAENGRPGARKLYQALLEKISGHPELLQPIGDLELLKTHQEWVEMLMTTLFPVTNSDEKDLFAVTVPFNFTFVYTSRLFQRYFLTNEKVLKLIPEQAAALKLQDDKCNIAYQLILARCYGMEIPGRVSTTLQFPDPQTGLPSYYEMELDPTFIDVVPIGELPPFEGQINCCSIAEIGKIRELGEKLPLDRFRFEGITLVRMREVTHKEVVNNIKNILLEQHSFDDNRVIARLENEMRTLIGIPGLKLGIVPFFNINDHVVFVEQHASNSMLLRYLKGPRLQEEMFKVFLDLFSDMKEPLLLGEINQEALEKYPMLSMILDKGYHSIVFFPLRANGKLVGILTAAHAEAGMLQHEHLRAVMPSLPLFELAMDKAAENLDTEVDKVIKKHFTAVQSSVEWKFTEAALRYLINKKEGKKAKIESIQFDHVFPLYGAIDIRNSTLERNNAIQLDLSEQLQAAGAIIHKARQQVNMPLLDEISFRISKFQYNVSNILFTGDEIIIDNFLKQELVELLEHLRVVVPGIQPDIDDYFSKLDPRLRIRVNHRHDFEESITLINQELARFVDQEQEAAQKIYPHYFERFVTDGIDFNMYIGQSITPSKLFDTFYLRNLKMWQLTTLTNAALLIHQLQERLSLHLQTTQLILAHSQPISISFRAAERKFDVEGAYNIRYEIIKKRIDKVHIKNSNERLTQPGKIAIVYTQSREAEEYLGFIEYLQNQKVLLHDLERLELEELQGITGLKALRVGINLEAAKDLKLETQRDVRQAPIL